MSKEFRTIGTNTDPLSVQLYFDENNSIKWKIIFKDGVIDQVAQNQTHIAIPVLTSTPTIPEKEFLSTENALSNIFEHIYIVGSKNKYQLKYNDIQLQIDETETIEFEVEYSSFDHLKYNRLINENLEKNIAWKHYLKSIRKNTNVNLNLSSLEISYINAFIDIIETAIASNEKECTIIIGSFSINQTNILWYKKNKDKFEISNSKVVLLWSETVTEQIDGKKIGKISNFKNPKAFVIKAQLYNDFLKKLKEKKITWESCLYQLIEENQFDCYQIAPQIFY